MKNLDQCAMLRGHMYRRRSDLLDRDKLYIRLANGDYLPFTEIKTGKIELANGRVLTIGTVEEVFVLELTDSDKTLLDQMHIEADLD